MSQVQIGRRERLEIPGRKPERNAVPVPELHATTVDEVLALDCSERFGISESGAELSHCSFIVEILAAINETCAGSSLQWNLPAPARIVGFIH